MGHYQLLKARIRPQVRQILGAVDQDEHRGWRILEEGEGILALP